MATDETVPPPAPKRGWKLMPDALSHKVRPMEEILRDSGFPYHVGQLTGAAEMAAHWMTLHEDEEVKAMGAKLGEVVRWFFAEDEPPR